MLLEIKFVVTCFKGISLKFFFVCFMYNVIFSDICENYCENGGTCIVNGKNPVCVCPDIFTGEKCQTCT